MSQIFGKALPHQTHAIVKPNLYHSTQARSPLKQRSLKHLTKCPGKNGKRKEDGGKEEGHKTG